MEIRPFDPVEYLDTEEAIAAYLADARAYGGQDLSDAVEVVARARATLRGARFAPTATATRARHQDR